MKNVPETNKSMNKFQTSVILISVQIATSFGGVLKGALPTTIFFTRPKPAYGRQGLEWDLRVRIQSRRVHFGVDTFGRIFIFGKNTLDLDFLGLSMPFT